MRADSTGPRVPREYLVFYFWARVLDALESRIKASVDQAGFGGTL
jgi:hypothetical protein